MAQDSASKKTPSPEADFDSGGPVMATEPLFSIIVPTYNRPQQLAVCLEALARLDYSRDRFEVIVVNDGSDVSPEHVVSSFRERLDLKLINAVHGGPAAARNKGAAMAKGHFLAFTDDDCQPFPDWLRALSARFGQITDCAVGGLTLNALPDNSYSSASQLIVDIVYLHYNANPLKARFFATNNMAVPADCFRAIGRFDSRNFPFASEDRDFCDRWLNHGYGMIYAPEAQIHHAHDLTFGGFLRQHFAYGRGASRFHKAQVRRGSGRSFDKFRFYFHLPFLLLQRFPPVSRCRAVQLLMLLAVWQVANAMGFFREHSVKEYKQAAVETDESSRHCGL
jgi:GT2 family glycosyltransferase